MGRKAIAAVLIGLGVCWAATAASSPSLADLRRELERRRADGLTAAEAEELFAGCLGAAAAEEGQAASLRATTLAADVVGAAGAVVGLAASWRATTRGAEGGAAAAPALPEVARRLRRRALAHLAAHPVDSLRWSLLLSERFQPPWEDLPRDRWREELEAYDALLVEVAGPEEPGSAAAGEGRPVTVRAELLYARAAPCVRINDRADWLTPSDLGRAAELLRELRSRYGDRAAPGAGGTYGERATEDLYRLERLRFGAPAPATAGVSLEGEPLNLADHRGRVVVLDFWTTFCAPCLAMVPEVRELQRRLEGEPVSFFGVNGDEAREKGLATARRAGMTWPSFWDAPGGPEAPIARAWRVGAWPSVFILDGEGRLRFKFLGKEAAEADLGSALRALLAELEPRRDGAREAS